MKVYICTNHHTSGGTSGADVYHHNLAKIMLGWGWEVRSLSTSANHIHDCEGATVVPKAEHIFAERWADIVITTPGMHLWCKKGKPMIVVKHNTHVEGWRFDSCRVLLCAHHLKALNMQCQSSFVWHPMNRYFGTKERGDINGPWLLVNCNENKGGKKLIELAERLPHIKFAGVLGAYGNQATKVLPNLEYWPLEQDMAAYWKKAKGHLMLSGFEGFPTTVMEAMSHGLPIIGNSECAGIVEVLSPYLCGKSVTQEDWVKQIEFMEDKGCWVGMSAESEHRAAEIEHLRDYEGLKNFLMWM